MIESGKVSILLHTSNRPRFLLRVLDYFETVPDVRNIDVLVLDASNGEHWAEFERASAGRVYGYPLCFLRGDRAERFHHRIKRGLEAVTTPYVLPAADDDLYFFDWLETGVALLDGDASFGVVYGHTLWFELDEFVPYGTNVKFFTKPVENPPERWLEAETSRQRLLDVANTPSDLATTGWYALQRTRHMREIIDLAAFHDLNDPFFERFLIIGQAALTKTRRLDEVFVARQVAKRPRPPLSFRDMAKEFEKLRRASGELLLRFGFDEASAEEVIEYVYRNEVALMKRADAKRHLRQTANAIPVLREVWRRLVPNYDAPYPPDPRLPASPPITECRRQVESIERVVSMYPQASVT